MIKKKNSTYFSEYVEWALNVNILVKAIYIRNNITSLEKRAVVIKNGSDPYPDLDPIRN